MANIIASVRHNLGRLTRFSGRDTQEQFWPWAILVFLLGQITGFLVMALPIASAMERMSQVMGTRAEGSSSRTSPAPDPELFDQTFAELTADLSGLWLPFGLVNALAVALLAASVVRRLHDQGRSGFWGLLPLPFMAVSVAGTFIGFQYAGGRREPSGAESLVFLAPLLFWLTMIVLVLLLLGKGDNGPNRFGSKPAAS